MRWTSYLLVVWGFVALHGQEPPAQVHPAAERWFQQGAWLQAAEAYERLASGYPLAQAAPRFLLRAGQARLQLGENTKADLLLQQAYLRNPLARDRMQILLWYGHSQSLAGNHLKALALWKEALPLASTPEQVRFLMLRRLLVLNSLGRYQEILLESESLLKENWPAQDLAPVRILRLEALDRLGLYAEVSEETTRDASAWPSEVQEQIAWYAAEAAYRLRQGGAREKLWGLLDSRPDILASAAVRLYALIHPDDVASLSQLAHALDKRLTDRPELMVLLHAQSAQRATEQGALELAEHHWRQAWNLRSQTAVPLTVPMALARSLEGRQPREALAIVQEADKGIDPLLMETHWDFEARHGTPERALELGGRLLSQFSEHDRRPYWNLRYAMVLLLLERSEQAEAYWRRYADSAPEVLRAPWQRVRIASLDAQGRTLAALQERLLLARRLGNDISLWLETVRSAISLARWEEARIALERVEALLPGSPRRGILGAEHRFWRGLLFLNEGRLLAADEVWAQLPDLDLLPETFRPLAYFYTAWLNMHLPTPRLERALDRLKIFRERYSRHALAPETQLLSGRAHLLRREWSQAEDNFQQAVEGPLRARALFQLAELYRAMGDEGKSRQMLGAILKEGLETAPDASWVLTDLDPQSRENPEAFYAIYRSFPRSEVGRRALFRSGELAWDQENWRIAALRFTAYLSRFPQGPSRATAALLAARSHARRDNLREAILTLGLFEESDPQAPELAQVLFLKAQFQVQAQLFEAALATLGALEQRFPQEALRLRSASLIQTARFQAEGKDSQEAEILVKIHEAPPDRKPPFQLELAFFLLDKHPHRVEEVESILASLASVTEPTLTSARLVALGRSTQLRQRPQEAIGFYLTAARTRGVPPDTAAEALYRAWAILTELDPTQAEAVLQALRRQFPNSSWYQKTLQNRGVLP